MNGFERDGNGTRPGLTGYREALETISNIDKDLFDKLTVVGAETIRETLEVRTDLPRQVQLQLARNLKEILEYQNAD